MTNTVNTKVIELEPVLLNARQACEYIGVKPQTLAQSRVNGELWGEPTPPYIKMARKVMYRKTDLDEWVDGLDGLRINNY